MKTMTAADAKNSFGLLLDTVQREPVIVTKKNRSVGMMLSMQDVQALFGGDESTVTRALEEARIDRKIELGRAQAKQGLGVVANDTFFDEMKNTIRKRFAKR